MIDTHTIEKYGKWVDINTLTEPMRKEQCLCLHCAKLQTCKASRQFYKLCIKYNVAFMTTRCAMWELLTQEAQ